MRRAAILSLAATAVLAASTDALATISLVSGNATYANTVPTSATSSTAGVSNFRPEGGATTDHLFANTWHWRINGVDTREFVFHSGAGFGFVEAGSGTAVGTQSWTGLGGVFSAVLTSTLIDGGAAGQAMLVQSMQIINTGAAALDISLFNFADYDVGGTFPGDTASLVGTNTFDIVDGANFVQHLGQSADDWQVTAFNTLYTGLTNASVTNLNNTGLPFGPGDYTGAHQWNRLIGIGGSVTVTAVHAVNSLAPAPGALAMLGVAGLLGGRRRRRA